MKKKTRLPVMPDVTYIATLLGLIFAPPALICAAGFAAMALMGEPIPPESGLMAVGAAAWGCASLWSLRRCREQPWNLPVQMAFAAVGGVCGTLLLHISDDPMVSALAVMMFYPVVMLLLHLLWREPSPRKKKEVS